MLKVVICDEEKEFCEKLKGYVEKYFIGKELECEIEIYHSGEELILQDLKELQNEIVFLGLNMDGDDEIVIARKIREKCAEAYIVLMASSVKLSLEGYVVEAIRYILKGDENFPEKVNESLDAILRKKKNIKYKKCFKFCECEKEITIDNIVYIESKLHKLEFHIMENKLRTYTMYGTLNVLEKMLCRENFLRVHQSFLVNMKYINKLEYKKVVMDNGQIITVPKSRYRQVMNSFVAYIRDS